MSVHEQAKGFARVADSYVRGRPDYPAAMVDWMLEATGVGPGDLVVDLGAGTGKFTRLLAAAGLDVTAIEPVAEMRAELCRLLPGVRALADAAEQLTLAPASVELVTCAQSFHWFANERSVAEIARVLRPGRYLVLVWNQRDPSDPVQAMLDGVLAANQDPAVPHSPSRQWKPVIDASPQFVPAGEAQFENVHRLPREAVADRLRSMSIFSNLATDVQDRTLAELDAVVPRTPTVLLPYRNEAYLYRRTA